MQSFAHKMEEAPRELRGAPPAAEPVQFAATASNQDAKARLIILERGRADRSYWSDLWAYRELFVILAWRDLAVRYKQTALGVVWAVIRPILTVIVLTIVFGRLARLPGDGRAPYVLIVYAGTLTWFLISTIFGDASNSLISNKNLITKVYFPRLIVPFAYVVVALVDFAVSFVLLLITATWLGFLPDWRIILLPVFVALGVLFSLGPALYFAALNVKYRDFRYVIPFLLQFGVYASPIGFSSAAVPEKWRLVYSLNPVVGIVDGVRWCLLRGEAQFYVPGFLLSIGTIALLLIGGIKYFRQTERNFADIL